VTLLDALRVLKFTGLIWAEGDRETKSQLTVVSLHLYLNLRNVGSSESYETLHVLHSELSSHMRAHLVREPGLSVLVPWLQNSRTTNVKFDHDFIQFPTHLLCIVFISGHVCNVGRGVTKPGGEWTAGTHGRGSVGTGAVMDSDLDLFQHPWGPKDQSKTRTE
jgi:hypothetical protein